MILITVNGDILGELLPHIHLIAAREKVNAHLIFDKVTEARKIIAMIKTVDKYKDAEFDTVSYELAPSMFTELKFRGGSKTKRKIEWFRPSKATYCSVCGVFIPGARYFTVDSIRFCPFCIAEATEKAKEELESMEETVKNEYYNVFLLGNL